MSRLADNGKAAGAVEKSGQVDPPADTAPAADAPPAKQQAGERSVERAAARPRRTAKPAPSPDGIAGDASGVQAASVDAESKPTEKSGHVNPPADTAPAADAPPAKQQAGERSVERAAARPRRTAKPAPSPDGIAGDASGVQAASVDAESKPTEKPAAKRPPARRAAPKATARAAKPAASTRKAAKPVAPKREVTPRRRATVKAVEAPVEARAVPESPRLNGQPAEAAQAEAPARQALWDARLEVCQIGWWRGYVKSQFYAEAIGPEGDRYGAGTSPSFRWWRSDPPAQTAAAVAAHEALVAKLLRAGWERDDQGLEWYEARFCRVSPRSLADRLARVREQGSPSR